jgi:hypothetical protein
VPSIDAEPIDQRHKCFRARAFDLQRKKMISARSTEVDGGNRLAHRVGLSQKRNPEYTMSEAGSDYEHGVRLLQRPQRVIDAISRHALPENDIRFQDTRTARTSRNPERFGIAHSMSASPSTAVGAIAV